LPVRGRSNDLLSEEGAKRRLELVPHAEFVHEAGAGDRNDPFNDAALSFLASLPD
jgi:hypothetical protein